MSDIGCLLYTSASFWLHEKDRWSSSHLFHTAFRFLRKKGWQSAVSYTHLDGDILGEDNLLSVVYIRFCSHCMCADVIIVDRTFHDDVTVSYTHLDVYKRQV